MTNKYHSELLNKLTLNEFRNGFIVFSTKKEAQKDGYKAGHNTPEHLEVKNKKLNSYRDIKSKLDYKIIWNDYQPMIKERQKTEPNKDLDTILAELNKSLLEAI